MGRKQIITISDDFQLIPEISNKVSNLGDLIFFSNHLQAESMIINSQAEILCIFDINHEPPFDWIEKHKDKFSSIGLVNKETFMNLFEKLNSLKLDKLITMPWQPGDLYDAAKDLLSVDDASDTPDNSPKVIELQNKLDSIEKIYAQQRSELQQVTSMLEFNLQQAESVKREMIPLLSAMISLRLKQPLSEAILPAKLATKIAENYILEDKEYKEIYKASMLHNIGMMALPDNIIGKTYNELTPDEQRQFNELVVKGQSILQAIPTFERVANTIRHLYERFDGTGFPDNLAGDAIPLHSRILVPAIDYYELQKGMYFAKKRTPQEALAFIVERAGTRYDPQVIKYFTKCINNIQIQNTGEKYAIEKVLSAANQ